MKIKCSYEFFMEGTGVTIAYVCIFSNRHTLFNESARLETRSLFLRFNPEKKKAEFEENLRIKR